MDKTENGARRCLACGSGDYAFRGRKKVPAETPPGAAEAVETKYRCKACGHEWRVREPQRRAG